MPFNFHSKPPAKGQQNTSMPPPQQQQQQQQEEQAVQPPRLGSSSSINPGGLRVADPDLFEAFSEYLAMRRAPPPTFRVGDVDAPSHLLPTPKRARGWGDDTSPGDISVVPGLAALAGGAAFAGSGSSGGGGSGGGGGAGRSLSAQSLAARERRRRISDRMQELGRLVPGGQSMNSAEMLMAAFRYVKFMQAQVGVLGAMDPRAKGESSHQGGRPLQKLLSSPAVQEKLSAAEQCVVTAELVEELMGDEELMSSPAIAEDLQRLLDEIRKGPPPS